MPHTQPSGKKRKLCVDDHCILAKPNWKARKPSHLKVEHGFLPSDNEYKTTVVLNANTCALKNMSKANKMFFVKQRRKRMFEQNTFFVIDRAYEQNGRRNSYDIFSKFHSVLQIILVNIYKNTRFVPTPVAIAGTTSLSNTHETIFDLSESEFIFEYHRKSDKVVQQTLPMVENGIVLQVGLTKQIVKQTKLLQRIHAFLQHFKDIICPCKRPLLAIHESFASESEFRLHYESLHLLINKESLCSDRNAKRKDQSAFDLLYDVWVCCYLPALKSYNIRYLPASSWDKTGADICLYEFSDEVDTVEKRNKLSYWAKQASLHYGFEGFDFIVPKFSLLYQDFMCKCINAQ